LRPSLILIFLSLLLAPATASYVFIVPVDVHSSTNTEVLMPGDAAVLSIELDSGPAQNDAGTETLAGTLSTPINGTLRGART